MKKPVALVILDGFGWRSQTDYNAITKARKPTFDYLMDHFPHAFLKASGQAVGLPPGTPGNSEVGHMTLGAGRIIEQPITRLDHAIADGSFFRNPVLIEHLKALAQQKTTLHLIGLLSDGNVHSSDSHLYAFIAAALELGVHKIMVHAILDGRDVPPRSAATYLDRFDQNCHQHSQVKLGSIMGRFYAMDRDKNWNRTAAAYICLTTQEKPQFTSWQKALDYYYKEGTEDEFIVPTQLDSDSIMHQGDGIICFNVRPDRSRQLISAFVQPDFNRFPVKQLKLSFFITPFALNHWPQVTVLFSFPPLSETLKQVLSENGKTILAVAETEKYAHVTYFFSGGHEKPFVHEKQILIPSLKVHDYKEYPQMSADEITADVINSLQEKPYDFYLINYANADMVGHSGDLQATIKAVECLDEQLKKLYDQLVLKMAGTLFITADHGNAELKYDQRSGQPHTAHTTSLVPFIYVDKAVENSDMKLTLHELSDVAPFILRTMQLSIPTQMNQI